MSGAPAIGDLIEVPPVRTVIRLEDGREVSTEVSQSFVFTAETQTHLAVLAEAISIGKGQGYFLHGDFGSGKSHFLAALYAWLSGRATPAQSPAAPAPLRTLAASGTRLLCVAVSLVRYRGAATLEEIVLGEAEEELGRQGHRLAIKALAGKMERHEAFGALLGASRDAGYAGVVLLIDELSEFLRSKPTSQALNDDARTLQLLGEMAGPDPLWIVAAVQESIERTGDVAQAILRKIKDRYPIRLGLSTTHIRAIVSGRLVRRKPGAEAEILKVHEVYRSLFPSFGVSPRDLLETYPVHPATIALLDGLGDLFSQHRGIVDFVHARIAGDPSRAIPSILDRPATELLGPDSIYEHFATRLSEFSAYYVYPRHIVPHLDQLIDRVVPEEADRVLARRVVRILVLHRIHPTAKDPDCGRLVELAACGLDFRSLETSARFLSEAVLDPLVAESPYLAKHADPAGDPRKAVYILVTEEDPTRVLGERIRRVAAEIADHDGRLLAEPLAALPESESWPGPALTERLAERPVTWCLSTRKVLIRLAHRDELSSVVARARAQVEGYEADFAVVFAPPGEVAAAAAEAGPWVTVWVCGAPDADRLKVLKEHLAARLVLADLKPSSPTDTALIQPARDTVGRLGPAASQTAIECFFAGSTTDARIRVDPAVRQLKRFDRLLESMAEVILAQRYPRFRGVAPQRFAPTARVYQQLLDDFVLPGSIALSEARTRSLAPAIDGLAVPLGLVEVRRGSYVFSPDTRAHPLQAYLFSLIDPASPVPLVEVLRALEREPYGLPHETALFLIGSLVAGGLLVARKKGRSIPLEFLSLAGIEGADEIGMGEIVSEADRIALIQDCPFLFPSPLEGAFGTKQQRDAWKETIRFRATLESLLPGVVNSLQRMEGFASLSGLDLELVGKRVQALAGVRDEIKVSYGAKEGLERFLGAWRQSGLDAAEVERTKALGKFLVRGVDELIFISHYARHQALAEAAGRSPEMETTRARVLAMLEDPATTVVPDGGETLRAAFADLRDVYAERYEASHAAANRAPDLGLDRSGERALGLLRTLASVPGLDRPQGLAAWLDGLESARRARCTRNVREELLRSPVCGCGYRPAESVSRDEPGEAARKVSGYLAALVPILKGPAVLEALAARSFALKDADPEAAARAERLRQGLEASGLSSAHLPDLLDSAACREIGEALTAKVDVRTKNIDDLVRSLQGRRLEPGRVTELFRRWLADVPESALVAVEGTSGGSVERPGQEAPGDADVSWWPSLHPDLLPDTALAEADSRKLPALLETLLEARYPSLSLRPALERLSTEGLVDLLSTEPFHTHLLAAAWDALALRLLSPAAPQSPGPPGGSPRAADPAVRRAIGHRLEVLSALGADLARELPARMRARVGLERLARDPWATESLRKVCRARLDEVGGLAQTWVATLDPVQAVNLTDGPLVVVIDGAPADVWLSVEDRLRQVLDRAGGRCALTWRRLNTAAATHLALDALLGLGGDPVERLDARGVPYHSLSGDEPGDLLDLAPLPQPGTAALIRIAQLDRRAHAGEATLEDLVGLLEGFVTRRLEGLLARCRKQGRPVVLTTDHGLSLARGHLVHGKGGPWEQAIYLAEWSP